MQEGKVRAVLLATSVLATSVLALSVTTGCRVENHKEGDNDNVKIATPFGGMSVKTNQAVVQEGVGLSVYPGAVLVKKERDKDSGAADVNLNFGSFHLGVKALSYRTPDAPAQVEEFYRKDMQKYGTVIFCRGNKAVGTPVRTPDGLSCERDGQTNVHVDEAGSVGELKAGSKQHQHLVAIDQDGSGTKIGLVALDLPGHLQFEDSEDKQSKQ